MADEQVAGATPADQGATPDPIDSKSTPAATADEPLGDTGLAALKREREQREAAEKSARELARKLKVYEDAEKTESEKTSERITALEAERDALVAARREDTLRLAASAAARKLGFKNPDLAFRLVASGSVEYDEKGQPKNVERLLEDLAKADPYLTTTTGDWGGGPRGTPADGGQDMNTLIRRAAGRN